mmetsp:Transcript_19125/g.52729  ORF Transcript_19125/g.52729 Transcript_19125/m.52729 type:complete len:103 (+) Transcript_19125:266-574(+)
MTDNCEVWTCLNEPSLPAACGGAGGSGSGSGSGSSYGSSSGNSTGYSPGSYGSSSSSGSGSGGGQVMYAGWSDLACYVYNEATGRFVFWGPNSLLELVPRAP